jgi:HAD superfamily hydrolase (TIGR01509 family)
MMIRAIIFDFGRVITAQKPLSLFGRYEKDLGLMPGTINPIMFGSQVWQDALRGRKTMKEFWYAIGPQLRLNTPEEIDAFRHRKLAVLSNSPPGLEKWLADWKILHLFDVVFCSGDEGVVKPDPLAFKVTLDRLDVEPEEAVFIDDTKGHVEAAQAQGLHGLLFTTSEVLSGQLEALLEER